MSTANPRSDFKEKLFADIQHLIGQNDYARLRELLLKHVICTPFLAETPKTYTNLISLGSIPPLLPNVFGNEDGMLERRPYIEFLFIEDFERFQNIVNSLDDSQFEVFATAMKDTALGDLFHWNMNTIERLKAAISEIKNYGEILSENKEPKGQIIISHAIKLETCIVAKESEEKPEINPKRSFKDLREILNFKITFLKKLHEQDTELSKHRGANGMGWKRLMGNLATILFPPLAIANICYRLYSGRWLFFNKTNSQVHVKNIEEKLMPEDITPTSLNLTPT
jgi:hypothetical protein